MPGGVGIGAARARRACAICALLAVALPAAAQARIGRGHSPAPAVLDEAERAWLARHGPLRFAADPSFAPIEWFDEEGRYRGLVADHVRLLEQRLGTRIEVVRYGTWDEALRAARSGEVDGLTAAQVTPERLTYLAYTPPLLDVPNVIVVRADHAGDLTPARLAGLRVVVTSGNAIHEWLRERFPAVAVRPVADDLACLTEVAFGRADATIVNLAIASHLIARHGLAGLRVAGDSGRSNALAIAVRRDAPPLLGIMTKGLAAVSPEEREEIATRWIALQPGQVRVGPRLAALVGIAVAVLVLVFGAVVGWSAALGRRVAAATAGLEEELAHRRRVEEELRRSQRKLALHLEQSVLAVIEWDPGFRVVDWNPAAERIFGWTRAEAVGRHAADLILPPSLRPEAEAGFRRVSAEETARGLTENVAKDGRRLVCEWYTTPVRDEGGRVTGALSMASDVTDRRQAEEALARSQRLEALAVLAGGIAHDFNNLLTGITGNLSLALAGDPDQELRELLQEAEAAGRRAQGLTRQLLTFARGGAPVKRVIDLEAVVREAAEFAARGSAVSWRLEAAPGLWPVMADPVQVGQVVQNLVLHAVQAMPAGGGVELALRNVGATVGGPGPQVQLAVTDHGRGIAEADRARIFDPFFTSQDRSGGLGLAVCHAIVVAHGGRIAVEARPGGGTTFEVLLPARPEVRPEAPRPPAPGGALHARVLLMDDEAMVRRAAGRILRALGCEVDLVPDGAAAVARFSAARAAGQPFDAVVLDLTVPGGTGAVAALASLRALDPGVRAVVSSGYSHDPVLVQHAEHGFRAALVKPFGTVEARAALQAALATEASS